MLSLESSRVPEGRGSRRWFWSWPSLTVPGAGPAFWGTLWGRCRNERGPQVRHRFALRPAAEPTCLGVPRTATGPQGHRCPRSQSCHRPIVRPEVPGREQSGAWRVRPTPLPPSLPPSEKKGADSGPSGGRKFGASVPVPPLQGPSAPHSLQVGSPWATQWADVLK